LILKNLVVEVVRPEEMVCTYIFKTLEGLVDLQRGCVDFGGAKLIVLKVEESRKFWCLGLNLLQGDRAWSGNPKSELPAQLVGTRSR
jgi:hypothetical protein